MAARCLRLCLVILLPLLCAPTATADEVYRIGAEDDWYPFTALREGKVQGMSADLVRAAFAAINASAAATGGVLQGDDRSITGLTYNSREIVPGDLFLALKGERDGHQFAGGAFASGAAAALVEHPVEGGPCVVVPDTLRGLEALGVTA